MDVISLAHRTRLWRIGPFSFYFYVLHPGQYHPKRRFRFRVHLQWGPRCMEMAI